MLIFRSLDLERMSIWQIYYLWKSAIYHSIKLPFDVEVAVKILNVIYCSCRPARNFGRCYNILGWSFLTGKLRKTCLLPIKSLFIYYLIKFLSQNNIWKYHPDGIKRFYVLNFVNSIMLSRIYQTNNRERTVFGL